MGAGTRAAAAVVAGLMGLALAGCGAGQDAPTSLELPSVPGVNVQAEDGSVGVRNAHVIFDAEGYPAGGEAPVRLWLVNNTYQPVRLQQATSAEAGTVSLAGEVEIPPTGTLEATLQVGGLNRQVGTTDENAEAAAPLPLTLRFGNGAEIMIQVTMAPPDQAQPRQPMDLDDH